MLRGLEASKGFLGGPRRSQEVLGSHIFPLDSYLNLVRILVKVKNIKFCEKFKKFWGSSAREEQSLCALGFPLESKASRA